jgi:leucyl aminopeptidase
MVDCFVYESQQKPSRICPIALVQLNDYEKWLATQTEYTRNWLHTLQFRPAEDRLSVIPNAQGEIERVLVVLTDKNMWAVGQLSLTLVPGIYQFENVNSESYTQYAIAFGLGAYQFTRYKKATRVPAQLFIPNNCAQQVKTIVESLYLVRNLINTPTDDMGPTQLAAASKELAQEFGATFTEIVGEQLLKENYPGIYTVGRASDDAPRLLDLRWGNSKHPKITLVGKGVCFDTGGLDIKPSAYMLLMKKDMAGGAHALGLARMIMANQLPICLRVLIPAVENAVSGNAYRPGDIIKSRKGLTIEIGNTDAEGRVVLADAITEAVSEKPELII